MDNTSRLVKLAQSGLSSAEEHVELLQLEGFRTLAGHERADNTRKRISEAMAELDRLLYLETRA